MEVIIKQLAKEAAAGEKTGDAGKYEWGLVLKPDFKVDAIQLHANATFDVEKIKFKNCDVLEMEGPGDEDFLQVVISKSLIREYKVVNREHVFILKAGMEVVRPAENLFIHKMEVPLEAR